MKRVITNWDRRMHTLRAYLSRRNIPIKEYYTASIADQIRMEEAALSWMERTIYEWEIDLGLDR